MGNATVRRVVAASALVLVLAGCSRVGLEGRTVKLRDGREVECVVGTKRGYSAPAPSCDWEHAK